jgi:uncharacterized protein YdaU (DUF1376 family)
VNYYPFHIGDYAVHTRHLSLMEDLAYRRLIDWYYIHEKPIPAETQSVARLIGMRDQVAEIDAVLREFFEPNAEGEWVNSRCEAEIARAQAAAARARTNGKKGGRPSESKGSGDQPAKPAAPETKSVPAGGPDKSGSKAPNPKTNPKAKTPRTPRKRGEATGLRFEEFWLAWPKNERKQDRAKCWDHWRRNDLDKAADAILGDVRTKRGTTKWQEGFIEAPLVYLRGKRWEDGVVPEADGGSELPKPKPLPEHGNAAPDAKQTAQMLDATRMSPAEVRAAAARAKALREQREAA